MARKTKSTESSAAKQPLTAANNLTQDTDMSQIEQSTDYNAHARSRCGGALRTEREKQGLSVQDVASKLRLSPKQIEAIEADEFTKLPEPTIVRGFIRNYAKQLKINVDPLLDAYAVIVPSKTQYELTVKPSSNMQVTNKDKPKAGRYLWLALAGILGLGVWLFYQNYVQKPSPTAPTTSGNETKLESLPQPALPAAERAVELPLPPSATELQPATALQPSTQLALPPAVADSAATTLAASAPVAMPATSVAPIAVPAEVLPAEIVPAVGGEAKLEFSANQETWVSVLDINGREVYGKTIFAGSRESLNVKLPVNVTVGNSGGTSMTFNGKTIDLAPHSRNNIAHIKLDK